MGFDGLLLLFLALAALCFQLGFRGSGRLAESARFALALMVLFAGLAGAAIWDQQRSMGSLSRLIDPLPEVDALVFVRQDHAPAPLRAVRPSRKLIQGTEFFWGFETEMTPAQVVDFYRLPTHRRGWAVVEMDPAALSLRRDDDELFIFVFDDGKGPSRVWYRFSRQSKLKRRIG